MTTVAQRLGLTLPPVEVTERAACARTDPDVFHPEGMGASAHDAKKVCKRCPVVEQCLQWALDTDEKLGVWGGLSPRQRTRLRRRRDAANPARVWTCPTPDCGHTFTSRADRATHRAGHGPTRERHACRYPGCGKSYAYPGSLTTHTAKAHEAVGATA